MPLGYCDGETKPIENLSSAKAGVWSSGAIYIPASTAATIAGCKITGMRYGIGFKMNIDGAKIWIRTSLDGADLAAKTVDTDASELVTGWNEASFDEPWVVPENCGGFYLGYSLHQKGMNYGLASDNQPCGNALFVDLAEGGWEDKSAEGTLFLQATVEGDNLPGVNLGVGYGTLPDRYALNKEIMSGKIRVNNLGALPVSKFDVSLYSGDKSLATTTINTTVAPGSTALFPFEFSPEFAEAGLYDLALRVENIAEGEDVDPADNDWTQMVSVLGTALERMVLVEEFSNETCGNCPGAAQTFHSIMNLSENKGRIAPVVHHSGSGTDFLTKPWDTDYHWFYDGGSYSPAFMVDRYVEYGSTPVFTVSSLDSSIKKRLAEEPSLQLDITAGFDANDSSKIVVVVKGRNHSNTPVCDDPYITLWLTEDNVQSKRQSGATSTFLHQHVARDINDTWGEPVKFEGSDFEYTYTFENVDPAWKVADLAVVGAVHNVKGDDRKGLAVANACYAASAKWVPMNGGTAVENLEVSDIVPEYYTLSGLRVNPDNLTPGLYIRKSGNRTEKILVK